MKVCEDMVNQSLQEGEMLENQFLIAKQMMAKKQMNDYPSGEDSSQI